MMIKVQREGIKIFAHIEFSTQKKNTDFTFESVCRNASVSSDRIKLSAKSFVLSSRMRYHFTRLRRTSLHPYGSRSRSHGIRFTLNGPKNYGQHCHRHSFEQRMEVPKIFFAIAMTMPSHLKQDQFRPMKMALVIVKAFPALLAKPASIHHLSKQHRRSVLAISCLVV